MISENSQRKSSRTPEVRALAVLLLSRDLTVKSLAAMTGIACTTLRSSLSRGVPEIRFRHRIEAALGWLPIWSSIKTVELRRQCFLKFDFDPCLLDVPEIRDRMEKFSMRRPTGDHRQDFVEAVLAHVAANPMNT